MAALAPAASADTDAIIAPSPANSQRTADRQHRLAGGHLQERHADLLGRHPEQFFEEAAAHPHVGFTQFIVRSKPRRAKHRSAN